MSSDAKKAAEAAAKIAKESSITIDHIRKASRTLHKINQSMDRRIKSQLFEGDDPDGSNG